MFSRGAVLAVPLSCGVVLHPLGAGLLAALIITVLAPANLTANVSAAVIKRTRIVTNYLVLGHGNNIIVALIVALNIALLVALFNFFFGLNNFVFTVVI